MRPFLFLGTRAEDVAADAEYDAMLRCTGLDERELIRHRLEAAPLGRIELSDYSGVIMGGGPFNISDPFVQKSNVQVRVEGEVGELISTALVRGIAFLGCCYGIGPLGTRRGGKVDRTYAEPVGPMTITLTEEGRQDPLFKAVSDSFEVYLGHKEAVSRLPGGAVTLASSPTCPVQAMRMGEKVYATQFHPELDLEGIESRIDIYADYGYFDPGQVEEVKERCRQVKVTEPGHLLARFVTLFAR